ncbi:MAG: aldehyde dehydrogenase (NADP(+)) [Candidatus Eisenbacteria bacterium]|nr:aldehyde dehydrogenase (NADP(+)) [Candidatus Eisenbacteria bacterium]
MDLSGANLIGGSREAGTGPSFRAVDPATGDALAPVFHDADLAQTDRAAVAAGLAFRRFAGCPATTRAEFLRAIADELEGTTGTLVPRAQAETGLPQMRIENELKRTTGQLLLFARLVEEGSWVDARIDRADPTRTPAPRPELRRMLQPIGPVAVFGASNFPLAFSVAGGDTASALAAGCPVVVKAHPAHPGTSEIAGFAVARAARRAGLPEGVLNLLHGSNPDVGLSLVRHPAVAAVGFTGSLTAGRALFDAAAAREIPIPVFAEMGSLNPLFLLPGAVAARGALLAQGAAAAVTLGVGQFCTKPGLIILEGGQPARDFLGALASALHATPAGTMLTARITDCYHAGLERAREVLGVQSLTTGTKPTAATRTTAATRAGSALLATDAQTFLHTPQLSEEIFGPTVLAVLCRDRLIWNGYPPGVEVSPAMHHGGPYPATTDARFTSVGTAAIQRFARPICFQDFPEEALPPELQAANPRGILRLVDGLPTRDPR